MTSAREQERSEFARHIHEHLGRLLTGVELKIARMAKSSGLEKELEQQAFESIVELVDEAVEAVRDFSASLRVLDDGVGIDPDTARVVDSHGVMGMEERAGPRGRLCIAEPIGGWDGSPPRRSVSEGGIA